MKNERQSLMLSASDDEESPSVTSTATLSLSTCSSNDDDDAPLHNSSPSSSFITKYIQYAKYTVSILLVAACVGSVVFDIFTRQTPMSVSAPPYVAFITMWVLLIWLGVLEGLQGSLVGLQPIDSCLYRTSHPQAYHQCSIIHAEAENNLNRFIVGRQFLVVLVVFCLNLCCGTGSIVSGIAIMIITVVIGQLSSEVNATNCMLDFINTSIGVITTYTCLIIESSGLLHSVYLVDCLFSLLSSRTAPVSEQGGDDDDQESVTYQQQDETEEIEVSTTGVTEPQPVQPQHDVAWWWYWTRVFFSFSLLTYAMIVTVSALLKNETQFIEIFSPTISSVGRILIFVGLICSLGILEGIQIAVFAVVNLPKEALEQSPSAVSTSEFVFSGNNFKAFLVGRQICVTTAMFLLAQVTTTTFDIVDGPVLPEEGGEMLRLQQVFFNTGLPGALITTIVASVMWRTVASSYPIAFMANPAVNYTIRLCLLLEASGVFSASLLLGDTIKYIIGFQLDESYIGPTGNNHGGSAEEIPLVRKPKLSLEYEIAATASTVSTIESSTSSSTDDDYDEENVFEALKKNNQTKTHLPQQTAMTNHCYGATQ